MFRNKIWIPYNPAELFASLNLERKSLYITRWISRNSNIRGWFINTKNSEIDHWHKEYEEALFLSLYDYKIIKKIEYGNLKAILFEKK